MLVLPRRSKKEEVRQAMGALDIKVICKVGGCKWSKAGTISSTQENVMAEALKFLNENAKEHSQVHGLAGKLLVEFGPH